MADVGLVPYSCNAIVVVGDEDNEAGAYQIGQQHARKVTCNVRHVVIQTAVLQKILFRWNKHLLFTLLLVPVATASNHIILPSFFLCSWSCFMGTYEAMPSWWMFSFLQSVTTSGWWWSLRIWPTGSSQESSSCLPFLEFTYPTILLSRSRRLIHYTMSRKRQLSPLYRWSRRKLRKVWIDWLIQSILRLTPSWLVERNMASLLQQHNTVVPLF